MAATPLITVCVCTFKRGEMLEHLLRTLERQRTDGLFTYDVVIADNDAARSAEPVVRVFAASSSLKVTYCSEPVANIARARNAALARATGDFVAFIDDDEFPTEGWLYSLFRTRETHGADGVLGPVLPHFRLAPPRWLSKGRFFDRPRYPTGRRLAWFEARSGNVLFARAILTHLDPPFRPQFATAGEDMDFFRRAIEQGRVFIWCDEAEVFEFVPPSRCTRRYLLRRAVLRGSNFPKHPTDRVKNALKSVVALPCYTVALPVLAVVGHHVFMAYLIKVLDHASRLLAFAGLPLMTERET
ncbi:MAG TPA: glycosyltransferase [Vicinamibacterales bacterium]|nr:glycosyltransferase [Vicinamibacterales bacterium]